jgi:hypothetical protein
MNTAEKLFFIFVAPVCMFAIGWSIGKYGFPPLRQPQILVPVKEEPTLSCAEELKEFVTLNRQCTRTLKDVNENAALMVGESVKITARCLHPNSADESLCRIFFDLKPVDDTNVYNAKEVQEKTNQIFTMMFLRKAQDITTPDPRNLLSPTLDPRP